MSGTMAGESWISRFPGLGMLPEVQKRHLLLAGRIIKIPAGTTIFGPDKTPTTLLLLLSGSVRVQQVSDSGREIVLYRVSAEDTCVLSTAFLLAYEDYNAEGIAETELTAVALPREDFDELIATSPEFRSFVFKAYSRRFTDLFQIIDEVAFQRLDIRLAQKILQLAGDRDTISATHQDLATELGTAREVVSRQLQEFQRREWIALSRGKVTILDRAGLAALGEE